MPEGAAAKAAPGERALGEDFFLAQPGLVRLTCTAVKRGLKEFQKVDSWDLREQIEKALRVQRVPTTGLKLSRNEDSISVDIQLQSSSDSNPVCTAFSGWTIALKQGVAITTTSEIPAAKGSLGKTWDGLKSSFEKHFFKCASNTTADSGSNEVPPRFVKEFEALRRQGKPAPDTLILHGLPKKWFSDSNASDPSLNLIKKTFESFGPIKSLEIVEHSNCEESMRAANVGKLKQQSRPSLDFCCYMQYDTLESFYRAAMELTGKVMRHRDGPMFANFDIDFDQQGFMCSAAVRRRKFERAEEAARQKKQAEEEAREAARQARERQEKERIEELQRQARLIEAEKRERELRAMSEEDAMMRALMEKEKREQKEKRRLQRIQEEEERAARELALRKIREQNEAARVAAEIKRLEEERKRVQESLDEHYAKKERKRRRKSSKREKEDSKKRSSGEEKEADGGRWAMASTSAGLGRGAEEDDTGYSALKTSRIASVVCRADDALSCGDQEECGDQEVEAEKDDPKRSEQREQDLRSRALRLLRAAGTSLPSP